MSSSSLSHVQKIIAAAGQPVAGHELGLAELKRAIAEKRALSCAARSSMGDREVWFGPATYVGYDHAGSIMPVYLVFPRPVPDELRHEYGEDDWEYYSQIFRAFGVPYDFA